MRIPHYITLPLKRTPHPDHPLHAQMQPVKNFGVDHKMGHYTGNRIQPITNACNNRAYFSLPKFSHKVANAMIKPKISKRTINSGLYNNE